MATLTIKNIPEPLVRRLKQQAAAQHRSLNFQVISYLEQMTQSVPVDADTLLALRMGFAVPVYLFVAVVIISIIILRYTTYGRSRWPLKPEGEVYELYLGPVYQGIGLGEHLFEAARHRLEIRRMRGLVVWALKDNHGACDFYHRRGGRPIARTHERFGRQRIEKIAYGFG